MPIIIFTFAPSNYTVVPLLFHNFFRMDIVSRLIEFKNSTGLTNSQFADKAEIARPTLSQFINGRNKRLSDELISKLHVAFPELNISWLLFGEGGMRRDSNFEFSGGLFAEEDHILDNQMSENKQIESNNQTVLSVQETPTNRDNEKNSADIDQKAHEIPSKVMTSFLGGAVPHPATERKIKSIMVFYSDNSYETFIPQD